MTSLSIFLNVFYVNNMKTYKPFKFKIKKTPTYKPIKYKKLKTLKLINVLNRPTKKYLIISKSI